MENPGSENRRKHPRTKLDLTINVTIINSPGEESLIGWQQECHTRDISFQGMCLICDLKIPAGAELEVKMHLDDPASAFTFDGIVIWSKPTTEFPVYETGIQFADINAIPDSWKLLVINILTDTQTSPLPRD